jgi:MFS family permease
MLVHDRHSRKQSLGRDRDGGAAGAARRLFMQLLDATIISTSLPQMGESFGVPAVAMSIGITVYMLTMAAFVPLSG